MRFTCLKNCFLGTAAALSLAACMEEMPAEGDQEPAVTHAMDGSDVYDLGDVYVDELGRTWEKVRYVEYSNARVSDHVPMAESAPRNTDALIMAMSLDEAAAFLRPVTEFGHYEYRLSTDDSLAFAMVIREAIQRGQTETAEDSMPDDTATVPSNAEKTISGYGTWYTINSLAASSPYNRVATMDQGAGLCTAEKLINNYTAVTAAHCVQDSSQNWMARQRIRFQAGSANTAYGGSGNPKPYLPSGCYARTVPGCWTGVTGTCDYAVLALRTFGGAWCNYADYNVGYFGYATVNNEYDALEARMATYPGNPPGSDTYPSLSYHRRTDAETNNNAWLYYHNDTEGGSSGGPVYNSSDQMRATHVGYLSGDWNVGMRLTTTVINFFKAYQGS